MTISVAGPALVVVLLASTRTVAFLLLAPPFSNRSVPSTVRVGLSLALSLPLVPRLRTAAALTDLPTLLGRVAAQVLVGTALGFGCFLVFAAIQAAGDIIDMLGGFTIATAYDPMSATPASVFGRTSQLLAVTLLFATNGHLLVVRGYLQTFTLLPLDASLSDLFSSWSTFERFLTTGVGTLVTSALQIAGPLVAVLFVADVALGLLTKVSPQLNAFSLGFPFKVLLTVVLFGITLPLLPGVVAGTVTQMGHALHAVVGR